jgi:hypothetical protein
MGFSSADEANTHMRAQDDAFDQLLENPDGLKYLLTADDPLASFGMGSEQVSEVIANAIADKKGLRILRDRAERNQLVSDIKSMDPERLSGEIDAAFDLGTAGDRAGRRGISVVDNNNGNADPRLLAGTAAATGLGALAAQGSIPQFDADQRNDIQVGARPRQEAQGFDYGRQQQPQNFDDMRRQPQMPSDYDRFKTGLGNAMERNSAFGEMVLRTLPAQVAGGLLGLSQMMYGGKVGEAVNSINQLTGWAMEGMSDKRQGLAQEFMSNYGETARGVLGDKPVDIYNEGTVPYADAAFEKLNEAGYPRLGAGVGAATQSLEALSPI